MAILVDESLQDSIDSGFGVIPSALFVLETIGSPPPKNGHEKFTWSVANRNMPKKPFSFGLTVATNRKDYPGTVHAPTEQILSVRFSDFSLNGRLKDSWNFQGYAVEEWQRLERAVELGSMVRITHRSIHVDGVITSVNFDYSHEGDIGYTLTVSPHHRQPGRLLQSSPRTVLNAQQLLTEVVRVRDTLTDVHASSPRFFVSGTLWSDVDALIAAWDTNISILDNIINQRLVLPDVEPGRALQRIADVFRLISANAADMGDLLYESRSDTHLIYQGGMEILRFDSWVKGMIADSARLLINAERAAAEMDSRATPNSIALYTPHQNEHLYKISNLFYGTPFNWRRIASRNNLGSALTMTGTELLIIPEAVARQ